MECPYSTAATVTLTKDGIFGWNTCLQYCIIILVNNYGAIQVLRNAFLQQIWHPPTPS